MSLTEFLLERIAEDEAMARSVWPERFTVRMLAECHAKRRIVEAAQRAEDSLASRHEPATAAVDGHVIAQRRTLRTLAAIYADHPDYEEAWRA